jgi:hypothetical protein
MRLDGFMDFFPPDILAVMLLSPLGAAKGTKNYWLEYSTRTYRHTQRSAGFPSKRRPCVAHGLHYSYSCACSPFFQMFACPLAEGLNHRLI